MNNLNLTELLHSVRDELIESQELRMKKGLPPLFIVDKLQIEVNFVVEQIKGVKGGVNLKVIEMGGNKTYTEQQVHKVTLDLKVPAGIKPAEISGNTNMVELVTVPDVPGVSPMIQGPHYLYGSKTRMGALVYRNNEIKRRIGKRK